MRLFWIDWQIGLSLIIPVAVALVLYGLEASRHTAPTVKSWRGIVAPYFASVSIIFGLFSALLVSDVWQKATNAKRAVQAESDSVRGIALLARADGVETDILPGLRAYVKAASTEEPYSEAIAAQSSETGKAYEVLLREIVAEGRVDAPVRAALLTGARDLLRAHDDRLHYATDITAPIKWVAILVFGAITQIALMLVHVDNRVPLRIAVGLFTVAFIFSLVIVAIFDAPFESILADGPGTSLELALQSL